MKTIFALVLASLTVTAFAQHRDNRHQPNPGHSAPSHTPSSETHRPAPTHNPAPSHTPSYETHRPAPTHNPAPTHTPTYDPHRPTHTPTYNGDHSRPSYGIRSCTVVMRNHRYRIVKRFYGYTDYYSSLCASALSQCEDERSHRDLHNTTCELQY